MPPTSTSTFDLVIIGAGINGAGIARDAAMRGLRVMLLDKADIGSGTSSASTRLIHGGLRYLEHGELGLVRESLREREILLKIAPHLVKPIPILIPVYEQGSRSRLKIRAGLVAYDLLSFDKSLPRHRTMSREQVIERYPGLNETGLVGGALYYDCQVQFAERLVLENVLSAKEHGAEVITYARVTRVRDDLVEFIRNGRDQEEIASTSVIVNASGPWIDQVNNANSSERMIGGTKGSHIVVRPFTGSADSAVYIEAASDSRPFFVIPWNSLYLIGTTDVRFENNADDVRSDLWEIDYLLAETNRAFPEAKLRREDICYTYTGVRPLPYVANVKEQSITRRHFIREHPRAKNHLSVVGGKLTTYRRLAEECVDLIFEKLSKRHEPCLTHKVPLPGAQHEALYDKTKYLNERWLKVYGSRASELEEMCATNPELALPLTKEANVLACEIVFAFKSELAETLGDCLFRRTMLGLDCDLGVGSVEAAARVGKQFLGWTDERASKEIVEYRRQLSKMLVEKLKE